MRGSAVPTAWGCQGVAGVVESGGVARWREQTNDGPAPASDWICPDLLMFVVCGVRTWFWNYHVLFQLEKCKFFGVDASLPVEF